MRLLRAADRDGTLTQLAGGPWLDTDVLGLTPEKACVFHRAHPATPGCALEAAAGAEVLATSCRQFPRLLLADARGWHLSLSAWCVTAASMIVDGGNGFLAATHVPANPRVHVDALDARTTWPPSLRPGVLAGHEAYAAWEETMMRQVLAPAASGSRPLGAALREALVWTDVVRAWQPADGVLALHTRHAWTRGHAAGGGRDHHGGTAGLDAVVNALMSRVPAAWRVRDWPAGLTAAPSSSGCRALSLREVEQVFSRYLGVRLAGASMAYQGDGVRSVLASLVSAFTLATSALARNGHGAPTRQRLVAALRAADWLQLHLLDREAWAGWCRRWETDGTSEGLLTVVTAAEALLADLPWPRSVYSS